MVTLSLLLAASAAALGPQRGEPEHVVVVQPFVTCGTPAGADAARWRIHEDLVDQVYAKAGVDFHFLEPRFYSSIEARDGSINLDQAWSRASADGAARAGGVLNAYFVNAVDGREGPLGRGGFGMPVLFLALGEAADRGMEAFVTAHEAGHCLGLQHAVDDPLVPDDIVNLMGDGPYLERVGPDGLHPSQVETVLRSPLVRARVRVLSEAEAREAMIDESFEPFFSRLQPREISAFLGRTSKATSLADQRAEARAAFQAAARGCTTQESAALSWLTDGLRARLGDAFPLLASQPWIYLKYDPALCGGFAHTRGLAILLSQRHVDRIVALHAADDLDAALRSAGTLLLHEQMHVLERCYPGRFAGLIESEFGFVHGTVAPHPWLTDRQVSNPDGLDLSWLIPFDDGGVPRLYWPRTLLRDGVDPPRMGADFLGLAIEVTPDEDGYRVVVDSDGIPRQRPLSDLGPFLDRFPIRSGHDHPHEVAAYLMEQVLHYEFLGVDPGPAGVPEFVTRLSTWARDGGLQMPGRE